MGSLNIREIKIDPNGYGPNLLLMWKICSCIEKYFTVHDCHDIPGMVPSINFLDMITFHSIQGRTCSELISKAEIEDWAYPRNQHILSVLRTLQQQKQQLRLMTESDELTRLIPLCVKIIDQDDGRWCRPILRPVIKDIIVNSIKVHGLRKVTRATDIFGVLESKLPNDDISAFIEEIKSYPLWRPSRR